MDEDLSIINNNTRNEKIKNFFVNNKNKIISGIIVLILIIIAVFSYDKYLIGKNDLGYPNLLQNKLLLNILILKNVTGG